MKKVMYQFLFFFFFFISLLPGNLCDPGFYRAVIFITYDEVNYVTHTQRARE